jgi:hypothetical protein
VDFLNWMGWGLARFPEALRQITTRVDRRTFCQNGEPCQRAAVPNPMCVKNGTLIPWRLIACSGVT